MHRSEAAGDYVPYLPSADELPPDSAEATLRRLAQFPAQEREGGPALAREALARFTGPVPGDEPRHELVVTHNFLIGWLVRGAPPHWSSTTTCGTCPRSCAGPGSRRNSQKVRNPHIVDEGALDRHSFRDQ